MVLFLSALGIVGIGARVVGAQCNFDHIFKKSFCCHPDYQGECPGVEAHCCSDFDLKSAREFRDLQWTTINPSALHAHSGHLLASKGSLYDVYVLTQFIRVRARLVILAAYGQAPDADYLSSISDVVHAQWQKTLFAQGNGFDWPMRVGPRDAQEFWDQYIAPLLQLSISIATPADIMELQERARLAQHAHERLVMWDQWMRAASVWGPAPAVSLYVETCCTVHDLVEHLLGNAADPSFALVGVDPGGVVALAREKGARVLVSGADNLAGDVEALPPPLSDHAEPIFPLEAAQDPATRVQDGTLGIVFVAFESFSSYFAALSAWMPKLRQGGVLIGFYVLTSVDAAAAMYQFAALHGLHLKLATHRCAVIFK